MQSHQIGFLGGGNMARALIGGLLSRGMSAARLSVGEPAAQAREQLARDFKVRVSADNHTAIDGCELIIVAVKPQEAGNVLRSLAPQLRSTRPVLVSVRRRNQDRLAQRLGGARCAHHPHHAQSSGTDRCGRHRHVCGA